MKTGKCVENKVLSAVCRNIYYLGCLLSPNELKHNKLTPVVFMLQPFYAKAKNLLKISAGWRKLAFSFPPKIFSVSAPDSSMGTDYSSTVRAPCSSECPTVPQGCAAIIGGAFWDPNSKTAAVVCTKARYDRHFIGSYCTVVLENHQSIKQAHLMHVM